MRAIFTPLMLFATLVIWGQEATPPSLETPAHVVHAALDAWQAKRAAVATAPKARQNVIPTKRVVNTIESVANGRWNSTHTWNCDCIPSSADQVLIQHEVNMTADVEIDGVEVAENGSLIDEEDVRLTFTGDFIVLGNATLKGVTLVAAAENGAQSLFVDAKVDRLLAENRTTLTLLSPIEVTGHVGANGGNIVINEGAALVLSKNGQGAATVQREGGEITGELTRRIVLPAKSNFANLSFARQYIALGLEGVTAEQFVGDIPTWGFEGADDEEGFISSIRYWDASAQWGYISIEDSSAVLPVWKGIYLDLPISEMPYTVEFSGTLPDAATKIELTDTAFSTNLIGNYTNANVDLAGLDEVLGENRLSLACWNIEEMHYSFFANGVSESINGTTWLPNQACEFFHSQYDDFVGELDVPLQDAGLMANGTFADFNPNVSGQVLFEVQNSSGFADASMLTLLDGASTDVLLGEDAINVNPFFAACDLYFEQDGNVKTALHQLDFGTERMDSLDLVFKSNRPLDGAFTISLTALDWPEGCLSIRMEGTDEIVPLEVGEMGTLEVAPNINKTHVVGTIFVVPPVRVETTSPGCEGEGLAEIDISPGGDGPWTVVLTDSQGNETSGNETDGAFSFNGLSSGQFEYVVTNGGLHQCGDQSGQTSVVSPTRITLTSQVQNNCGDGGEIRVTASGGDEPYVFKWSNGAEGNALTGLDGGEYVLIVSDAFECKDTLEVEVLELPDMRTQTEDGACDGSTVSRLELNSDNNEATWNVSVFNENGDLYGFANGSPTPMSFAGLPTGEYNVTIENLDGLGCPETQQRVAIVSPTPMVLEASSQSAQCDANVLGSASAQVTGGDGEVTFVWSNGETGATAQQLPAGMHEVTATDDHCQTTSQVEVLLNPAMEVTALSPGCQGSGVTGLEFDGQDGASWTVTLADGNNSPLDTLVVEGGMTQTLELEGGDYNVTWIANNNQGCPSEEMKASLQPASNLEVTAVTTPMECGDMNSAAIELHVSGGAGEVSVMWTHGAQGTTLENLTHGNYEALLVDDNGCSERIEVEIDESPTVVANFEVPTAGLTDSEQNSALFNFTNTSEGLITGNTWYFGDTDTPSYDYHGTHTFTEAGIYDVFLNVWNDRCSHTVRKTVVVEFDDQHGTQNDLPEQSTNIVEGRLDDIKAPATTASGWKMDLGAAAEGMTLYAFDLNGRQLCMPAQADANGQISVENSNWPKLVYLRLVHEPTNSVRVWKMER